MEKHVQVRAHYPSIDTILKNFSELGVIGELVRVEQLKEGVGLLIPRRS